MSRRVALLAALGIVAAVPAGAHAADLAAITPEGAVVVADADGAAPLRVADVAIAHLAWSPDGSRLGMLGDDGRVHVVGADGANRQVTGTRASGIAWAGTHLLAMRDGRLVTADVGGGTRVVATRRALRAHAGGDGVLAGATARTAWVVAAAEGASAHGGPPVVLAVDIATGRVRVAAREGAPMSAGNVFPPSTGMRGTTPMIAVGARAGLCQEGATGIVSPRRGRLAITALLPQPGGDAWTRLLGMSAGGGGVWAAVSGYTTAGCLSGEPRRVAGRILRMSGARMVPTGIAGTAVAATLSGDRLAIVRGSVSQLRTSGVTDLAAGPLITRAPTAGAPERTLLPAALAAAWRP